MNPSWCVCTVTFWQKLISQLVTRVRTRTRNNMVLNHLNDFLGQNCQCGRGRERRTSDWERWAAAWYKGLFYHHPTTCNSRCFFENSLGEHEGRTFRSVGTGCAPAPMRPPALKILAEIKTKHTSLTRLSSISNPPNPLDSYTFLRPWF